MDTGVTVEESNCKACQTETGATARVPEGKRFWEGSNTPPAAGFGVGLVYIKLGSDTRCI